MSKSNETIKENGSNILIAFSMLVGIVAVYTLESLWKPSREWISIDINNLIDVVDVVVDIALYGTSIIITHPMTIIMFVGFMVWFMVKLK